MAMGLMWKAEMIDDSPIVALCSSVECWLAKMSGMVQAI